MNGISDIVGKFVECGKNTEELSKNWTNNDGEHSVPNKKSND